MFCVTCGKELPAEGRCPACGQSNQTTVERGASPDVAAIAVAARDVLITVLRDPVGGIPASFVRLGKQRAMEVAVAVAVLGAVLIVVGVFLTIPAWARPSNAFFRLLVLAIAMLGGLSGAGFAARKLLQGTGSPEGDVFIAAVSLAPISVLVFASGLIGITNVEIIGGLAMFAITWTVLMLYSGVTRVSSIPEGKSAYAVPLMLIGSLWLTSVAFRAMF